MEMRRFMVSETTGSQLLPRFTPLPRAARGAPPVPVPSASPAEKKEREVKLTAEGKVVTDEEAED
jgi:hypothetical protein